MTTADLYRQMQAKKTCLCVGLDTDLAHPKFPQHLKQSADPLFEFNKAIIDATQDVCIGYKPNFAFYEALGSKGFASLEKTMDYIPKNLFTVADAKRGDIGNTAKQYAQSIFGHMDFDSVTVSPYMGRDTIEPFLAYSGKFVIVLLLTSNQSYKDLQLHGGEKALYKRVAELADEWGTPENLMFVVGATQTKFLKEIRGILKNHFWLVPGIGAQGGDLDALMQNAQNDRCGLIVNSSRGIIFSGKGDKHFADAARQSALNFNAQVAQYF